MDKATPGQTCIDTIRFLAADSAPAKVLYEKFGITAENVVNRAGEIQGGSES